ncbi:MAG TPA: zf-HC2 domain-containing protein [Novimethylophilus sp.]|jgi:hypothetical protein|uniref:zf-HC2 domain-containing protein n=1 Tax=Novimethylophilus sp. TaxID=2137426 RepID=UPI002F40E3E4
MLNCKQASALMSRAMDEKLPFGKRMALKLHLFICDGCTNFSSQTFLLRKAARSFGKCRHCKDLRLSDEARQRIFRALKDVQARKD